MKVILLEDVDNVGAAGNVVDVAAGFARNVLFPFGRAAAATVGRVRQAQAAKTRVAQRLARRAEKELARTQRLVELVDRKTVTLTAPAGPLGKLHGAVTARDIAAALSRAVGVPLLPAVVRLRAPIHEPGEQKVSLEFPHGLEAEVTVVVEGSAPPEEAQQ